MSEIPAEAWYDLTLVRSVAVSPDGDRVAVLAREYAPDDDETVDSLWVVPADGSRDPHRLTRASDASAPTWGPDGDRLAFLATRETDPDLRVGRDEGETDDGEADDGEADDESSGDDPKSQVWVFDVARGGDAGQVTDREEGVSAFDWGPDGDRLVVAARDPTDDEREYLEQRREDGPVEVERLQHKMDGAGYLDAVTTYLFVVDVETREERRLDDASDGGYGFHHGLEPAWAPGERIAFVANHTERPDDNYVRDVYTIAPDGTDRRRLTDGELMAGSPVWSADGALAFTGGPPDNWYVPTEVYVADPAAGDYESVSESLDRTLAWTGSPEWLGDGTLLGLLADGGWTRLVRFDPEGSPERVFDVQDRAETLGSFDVGGGTVAVETSRPAGGAEVDALDVADVDATDADPRTRLTGFTTELVDEHPMPGCERITFDGADGTEVEAIVYHPSDFDPDDPDARGLLLTVHGGPMAYDEPRFSLQDAFFTSRGYIVARVNYRGSTSYGRAFCEALKGAWGTRDVADLQAGVDTLLERGWADPDRLFPTGFSQGGVNTAYLVTRDNRWTAAAAEHGVYDLRSDFGTADAQNWYEADYGLPWENPEKYDDHSPITDVGGVETPLLVTAGGNDWRCPPSQAEQLYVSVRKQGVDAKLVVYPDENHDIGDPDRAIHRLEELDSWFAKYDPDRESAE